MGLVPLKVFSFKEAPQRELLGYFLNSIDRRYYIVLELLTLSG